MTTVATVWVLHSLPDTEFALAPSASSAAVTEACPIEHELSKSVVADVIGRLRFF
jgi:hypothetical protein